MNIKPNKKAMHLIMESYANSGNTEGTKNVMRRSRAMGFTPTSDTMNIILKSIVNSADTNAWDAITKCYSEHFGYLKFIPDSDTYIVLMRACEKFQQPDHAINWFNELLSFGSPVTKDIRDTFQRTLGTERYQSYLCGLHSQFRAALHQVDTVLAPISLSIRAHESFSLRPIDSYSPLETREDDAEYVRKTSDEASFNTAAAGIVETVESPLISSYPIRSLEAVRSMMIDISSPQVAAAGSSSSANGTSAGSLWSKICKLRAKSEAFARNKDTLGAERILSIAADWHVEPGMVWRLKVDCRTIE